MKIPFVKTSNFTKGRAGNKIEYIIIHSMAGYFLGTQTWFRNPNSQVSAHYLISQKGEVAQMVNDVDTAWHCHGINSKSIGIELEDRKLADISGDWITKELYQTLLELVVSLCKKHNLTEKSIYGHCEPLIQKINGPKFAHSDPGKFFNMNKFREDVKECLKKD